MMPPYMSVKMIIMGLKKPCAFAECILLIMSPGLNVVEFHRI